MKNQSIEYHIEELQMDAIVQALLVWIAGNSHYTVENIVVPAVVVLNSREITTEYYSEQSEFIPIGGIDDRIWALYDALSKPEGVIYLRFDGVEFKAQSFENNPILTERLLHELIHHVQYQTGETETYLCPAIGEKEAYRLGGVYFNQRFIEDPMPNRNFWAHVYSRC